MSRDPLPDIGTIHERLAFARKRAGLTQVQLAQKLGIGERTLQSYESGATKVPAELVPRIERLADIPPGWILYDGSSDEFDKRRRLPPGSGLVSTLLAVGTLAFSGIGSGTAAVAPCQCYSPAGAREPRVKLATRKRRTTDSRGLRPIPGLTSDSHTPRRR